MPVDILYKVWSTGVDCANPAGYSSTLPADGVVKCIKISGFAIPRGHKAKIKVKFDFRPKDTDWPANKKPDLNFRAGFNFVLKKMFTYGYGTQYARRSRRRTTSSASASARGSRRSAASPSSAPSRRRVTRSGSSTTGRRRHLAVGAVRLVHRDSGCLEPRRRGRVLLHLEVWARTRTTRSSCAPVERAVRRSALQRHHARHGANAPEQARRQGVRRGGLQRRRQPVAGQPDDQPSEQRALERRHGQGHVLRATGGGVHVLDVGSRQQQGPEPQRGDREDRERPRRRRTTR